MGILRQHCTDNLCHTNHPATVQIQRYNEQVQANGKQKTADHNIHIVIHNFLQFHTITIPCNRKNYIIKAGKRNPYRPFFYLTIFSQSPSMLPMRQVLSYTSLPSQVM